MPINKTFFYVSIKRNVDFCELDHLEDGNEPIAHFSEKVLQIIISNVFQPLYIIFQLVVPLYFKLLLGNLPFLCSLKKLTFGGNSFLLCTVHKHVLYKTELAWMCTKRC